MKKFLLGTVALTALAGPAFAADMPARTYTKAPPPYTAPDVLGRMLRRLHLQHAHVLVVAVMAIVLVVRPTIRPETSRSRRGGPPC